MAILRLLAFAVGMAALAGACGSGTSELRDGPRSLDTSVTVPGNPTPDTSVPYLPNQALDAPLAALSEATRGDQTPSRAKVAGPSGIPAYTERVNKRYIGPNGNDAHDGLSPQTPWRSLQKNVLRIPAGTEVIFLDGDYLFGQSIYYSTRSDRPLPADITIRAESFRGVTLRGAPSPQTEAGGIAFVFIGGDVRVEVWGFNFKDWHGSGAGVILAEYDVDGLRIIGNYFEGNGRTINDHMIYLSSGNSFHETQVNWVIEGNEARMKPGTGAFLHIYGGPYGAHDGTVRANKVYGSSNWAILQDNVRAAGTRSNILVQGNDLRGHFDSPAVHFSAYGRSDLSGVDQTFILEGNIIGNSNPYSHAVEISRIAANVAQHRPTLRNNRYLTTSGGTALKGTVAGTGDVVEKTLSPTR